MPFLPLPASPVVPVTDPGSCKETAATTRSRTFAAVALLRNWLAGTRNMAADWVNLVGLSNEQLPGFISSVASASDMSDVMTSIAPSWCLDAH